MTAIKKDFERWNPREESSWVFQVFKQYTSELEKNLWTFISGSKYVYKNLGLSKAKWTDDVKSHFTFEFKKDELYKDLRDWSNNFNEFDNWVNLNCIMSMSSNFETYLASIVSLALTSDPGLIFGASKLIDGIRIIKLHTSNDFNIEPYITSCTKGDWSSRASAFKKIFGHVPEVLVRNINHLDDIRNLRNKVGHAFGRDIEKAREHLVKKTLPIEIVSRERTLRYQRLLWGIAKNIDVLLLQNHIGEFQALNFYHSMYPSLRQDIHPSERAIILKKRIGSQGMSTAGKGFCKGLVSYYENI